MRSRVALGTLGVLAAMYGALLLLSRQQPADWVEIAAWFVAGVVLHDFVLAPLMLGTGVVLLRLVPPTLQSATVVGAVVLGCVTLLAVPVLGGFGGEADNPTLFDRPYVIGWVVLASMVVAGVLLAAWLQRSRHREEHAGGVRTGR